MLLPLTLAIFRGILVHCRDRSCNSTSGARVCESTTNDVQRVENREVICCLNKAVSLGALQSILEMILPSQTMLLVQLFCQ